jgi:hypothetical protein
LEKGSDYWLPFTDDGCIKAGHLVKNFLTYCRGVGSADDNVFYVRPHDLHCTGCDVGNRCHGGQAHDVRLSLADGLLKSGPTHARCVRVENVYLVSVFTGDGCDVGQAEGRNAQASIRIVAAGWADE